MDKLLEKYTKTEIADICGVSYRTVNNWVNLRNMPFNAIEKMGYTITPKENQPVKVEIQVKVVE